jgi:5-methyltetrahydropteroyltriglutamate--homocysteine methyltransferase
MTKLLLTTSVGSFPKPDYLITARNKAARGELSEEELDRLGRQATEHWIRLQEELDMDVLVDGEMNRGDMVAYFSEHMAGFKISGLVRSYGNRYYRKPVAVGPVGRGSDITIEWWRYSQGLTDRPVKGMLTGPYTIADWSFNEYYNTREEFVMALAELVRDEALALEKAGAKYIQVDEPAVSTRPDEMELASRALGVVTKGLSAMTITHMCYGDFSQVFDGLTNLPVDMLDLEFANADYSLVEDFRQYSTNKLISYGVLDVHNHRTESVEQIVAGIRKGLEVFRPEQLYIDPDCGLKTRTEEEAVAKLRNMMAAVKQVRAEHGWEE